MHFSILAASCFALAALAQNMNCGAQYNNRICDAGQCCSGAGWCDTTPAHCDPVTCQPPFSGSGSTCTAKTSTGTGTGTGSSAGVVPEIDVCGHAVGGVSCPGAGKNGYFYRCCSSVGHCGPKNPIQDQNLYCGTGCQVGYGDCATKRKPTDPPAPHAVGAPRNTCGAIPNARCPEGQCCSGSNFCGTGPDFCGAANWCQPKWGRCDSTVRAA